MRASRDMTREATRTVIERGSKCGGSIEMGVGTHSRGDETETEDEDETTRMRWRRRAMGERET